MTAKNDIYVTQNIGNLVSDNITADAGSIGLTTVNGDVIINHISAPELIEIAANGNLIDIETIDPKKIDMYVSGEGGKIDLNKALVSNEVKLAADNIIGNFTDIDYKDPLSFYVTGNDGERADLVTLKVNTSNFGIEKFDSTRANITSSTNNLNWKQVRIADRLDVTTPTRTILLKNEKGFLDESVDSQLYETGWFDLITGNNDIRTSAYVINGVGNADPNGSSTTLVNTNNDGLSKSEEKVKETLNPLDMRYQIQNKRDSIRYDINTNGTIKLPDIGNFNVKVLDISSGGAGIQINKDVPMGQEMNLKVSFNGLEINAKAKVVSKHYNVQTGTYKLGLEFTDIPPGIAQKIPYACMSASTL